MNRWFHIILTSYNRPTLLRRALESVLSQTDNRWTCYVMDDNSNLETRRVIQEYRQRTGNIEVHWHSTKKADREATVRYSVLINSILPGLAAGVVGYLCDNAEWDEELVEKVLAWFEADGKRQAGYVKLGRDVWKDGESSIVESHPPVIPLTDGPVAQPDNVLDHSQVFHRLPMDIRWPEDPEVRRHGDGVFFTRLVEKVGPIEPIEPDRVLAWEHWPA